MLYFDWFKLKQAKPEGVTLLLYITYNISFFESVLFFFPFFFPVNKSSISLVIGKWCIFYEIRAYFYFNNFAAYCYFTISLFLVKQAPYCQVHMRGSKVTNNDILPNYEYSLLLCNFYDL